MELQYEIKAGIKIYYKEYLNKKKGEKREQHDGRKILSGNNQWEMHREGIRREAHGSPDKS